MKRASLPVTFGVIAPSLLQAMLTAYAQDQTAGGRTDKIKEMLLRPAGWSGDYRGVRTTGIFEIIFEARGEKIVAKIRNLTRNASCERDVKITSDVVKFDGCFDIGIALRFDPNDPDYPFRGASANDEYKLKAK